jgi:hypothetical protein
MAGRGQVQHSKDEHRIVEIIGHVAVAQYPARLEENVIEDVCAEQDAKDR